MKPERIIMQWLSKFWATHGERLVFMAIATAFGIGFWFLTDMTGEAKTLLIAVATLALNKARSTPKDEEPPKVDG